jgi:hypothetical protein
LLEVLKISIAICKKGEGYIALLATVYSSKCWTLERVLLKKGIATEL